MYSRINRVRLEGTGINLIASQGHRLGDTNEIHVINQDELQDTQYLVLDVVAMNILNTEIPNEAIL